MPPLGSASKSKNKNRDGRRSRSRNTTPSSVLSAGTAPVGPSNTPLLDLDAVKFLVTNKPSYADIIEQLETQGARLESSALYSLIDRLKHLSDAAEKRTEECEKAIRVIHELKKEASSTADQQERDRQADQARRSKARKVEASKNTKAKKRKDRPETLDSVEIKKEGKSRRVEIPIYCVA
jgi:transcriptional adapter 3